MSAKHAKARGHLRAQKSDSSPFWRHGFGPFGLFGTRLCSSLLLGTAVI